MREIAGTIDHSLLRPDITTAELVEGCALAKEYHCVSVCVRPSDLPIVARELRDSGVLVTTVAAFPHGTATTESKVFETIDAIEKGAVEVDVVMNYARFLSGEFDSTWPARSATRSIWNIPSTRRYGPWNAGITSSGKRTGFLWIRTATCTFRRNRVLDSRRMRRR